MNCSSLPSGSSSPSEPTGQGFELGIGEEVFQSLLNWNLLHAQSSHEGVLTSGLTGQLVAQPNSQAMQLVFGTSTIKLRASIVLCESHGLGELWLRTSDQRRHSRILAIRLARPCANFSRCSTKLAGSARLNASTSVNTRPSMSTHAVISW